MLFHQSTNAKKKQIEKGCNIHAVVFESLVLHACKINCGLKNILGAKL